MNSQKSSLQRWKSQQWILFNGIAFALTTGLRFLNGYLPLRYLPLSYLDSLDAYSLLSVVQAGIIGLCQSILLARHLKNRWWLWPIALVLTGPIVLIAAYKLSIFLFLWLIQHRGREDDFFGWCLIFTLAGLLTGLVVSLPQLLLLPRQKIRAIHWLGASSLGNATGWLATALLMYAVGESGLAWVSFSGEQLNWAESLAWLGFGGLTGTTYGWFTDRVLRQLW